MEALFLELDQVMGRARGMALEPAFSDEVARRMARVPTVPATEAACLAAVADVIAYSQAVPADRVDAMITAGGLAHAFGDFEVDRVAALLPHLVLDAAWEHSLKAIGKKGKVAGIIGAAAAMQRLREDGTPFPQLFAEFPVRIRNDVDIRAFWRAFDRLHRRLRAADMPFVRAITSLLHLLLNFGFDCAKPDSVVRRVAEDAGLLGERQGDAELRQLVEVIQRYSVARDIRPSVVDFHCLVAGNQRWARQFIQPSAR